MLVPNAYFIIKKCLIKNSWEPPSRNPHTVEGYRVFWYDIDESGDGGNLSNSILGNSVPGKADTKDQSIILEGLQQHVHYELVVKAGNHFGKAI